VEVLGEKKSGFSLFRKSDSPLTDVPVTFKVLANSDIQVSTEKQTTDITGQAETFITAGKQIGDQYLQIIPDGNTEKAVVLLKEKLELDIYIGKLDLGSIDGALASVVSILPNSKS
jgi:hypothetical protein